MVDAKVLKNEEGVSTVLGAVLVLGIFMAVFPLIYTQYVESSVRDREVERSEAMEGQLRKMMDEISGMSQIGDAKTFSVPLGTGSIRFAPVSTTAGTLQITPGVEYSVNSNHGTSTATQTLEGNSIVTLENPVQLQQNVETENVRDDTGVVSDGDGEKSYLIQDVNVEGMDTMSLETSYELEDNAPGQSQSPRVWIEVNGEEVFSDTDEIEEGSWQDDIDVSGDETVDIELFADARSHGNQPDYAEIHWIEYEQRVEPEEEILMRVDDLTDIRANDPSFYVSYDVNFQVDEVSITADSTEPGANNSDSVTLEQGRGGVLLEPGAGEGEEFEITVEAIQDGDVIEERTMLTDADTNNPTNNDDLSIEDSAFLDSYDISDQTDVTGNEVEYVYDYEISGTGSFSEVELMVLNREGDGASTTQIEEDRTGQEISVSPGDGKGTLYKIGVLVRDEQGTVVDDVILDDVADGEDPEREFELTVDSTEGGEVTDPGEGTDSYEEGTEVDLMAVAEDGYEFVEWTGDVETIDDTNSADTTITMENDYSISAEFEEEVTYYDLNISASSGGYTDPLMGTHTYREGEEVTIEAISDEGWGFENWTGDVTSEDKEITLTMDSNKSIRANFVELHDLTVETVGEGEVTVSLEDENVAVTDENTLTGIEDGTEVGLFAEADGGWVFHKWTGDLESGNTEENISMDGDKEVVARFAREKLELQSRPGSVEFIASNMQYVDQRHVYEGGHLILIQDGRGLILESSDVFELNGGENRISIGYPRISGRNRSISSSRDESIDVTYEDRVENFWHVSENFRIEIETKYAGVWEDDYLVGVREDIAEEFDVEEVEVGSDDQIVWLEVNGIGDFITFEITEKVVRVS
ncbi:MAG: InlB B-repeat-containing protein [Candidatus Hadarchaeia archaeon]